MGSKGGTLLYSTLGELIQEYRNRAGLTISELARQCGIHKGVISKIEMGDTKRPELRTIKPIAKLLEIPIPEILEYYLDVEQRPDVLLELIKEAVELSNTPLITKTALRFLQTPYEESYILIERLYDFTENLADTSIKLSLYDVIIKYARERGMQRFLAKGLLQKYLIERNDLKRMEESFRNGEEILHYTKFLSKEERITFYFRMGLHAFAIKKYEKCIELCEAGLEEEASDNELKARAYLAMINSLYFLNEYNAVEKHLDVFEKFEYDFVHDAAKTTRGIVKAKKKEFDVAIPILRNCLEKGDKDIKLHAANELLEVFFQLGDMDSIAELLKKEKEILPDNPQTPYKHISVGMYFQYKGKFQTSIGLQDDGMESYIKSLKAYGMVNAFEEITNCMNDIFSFFIENSRSLDLQYLEMINEVYNNIINGKK